MGKYKMISPEVANIPGQEKPADLVGAPIWRYDENPIIGRNPLEGVARIWGGTKLHDEFGYKEEGRDVGECWGISAHPGGDGATKYGAFEGWKLSELWEKHPEVFGNLDSDRFPLLVKLIDARDDLSIQVHPDDKYAKAHENGSLGKTECRYVLDCPENASLVIGHNATSKEELSRMIEEGKWNDLIREIPVKKVISFLILMET